MGMDRNAYATSVTQQSGDPDVASVELGKALHVSWLATFGGDEGWLAFAVWAVVFVAMLGSFAARWMRDPARHPADGVGTDSIGRPG